MLPVVTKVVLKVVFNQSGLRFVQFACCFVSATVCLNVEHNSGI